MEEFSSRGTRHRPIRTHQPQVEAERFRDRHGEPVPASRTQHNFNTGFMGPAQRLQIGWGDLDIGVQQSAIKVDGDEAYRACLLYTSDAADEEDSVDLGGRGI